MEGVRRVSTKVEDIERLASADRAIILITYPCSESYYLPFRRSTLKMDASSGQNNRKKPKLGKASQCKFIRTEQVQSTACLAFLDVIGESKFSLLGTRKDLLETAFLLHESRMERYDNDFVGDFEECFADNDAKERKDPMARVNAVMKQSSRKMNNPIWQHQKGEGAIHNEVEMGSLQMVETYFPNELQFATTISLMNQGCTEKSLASEPVPFVVPLENDKYVLSSKKIFRLTPIGDKEYFEHRDIAEHCFKYLKFLSRDKMDELNSTTKKYEQAVVEATETSLAHALADALTAEKVFCGNACKMNTYTANGTCCSCAKSWEIYRHVWPTCKVCRCITPFQKFVYNEDKCKSCHDDALETLWLFEHECHVCRRKYPTVHMAQDEEGELIDVCLWCLGEAQSQFRKKLRIPMVLRHIKGKGMIFMHVGELEIIKAARSPLIEPAMSATIVGKRVTNSTVKVVPVTVDRKDVLDFEYAQGCKYSPGDFFGNYTEEDVAQAKAVSAKYQIKKVVLNTAKVVIEESPVAPSVQAAVPVTPTQRRGLTASISMPVASRRKQPLSVTPQQEKTMSTQDENASKTPEEMDETKEKAEHLAMSEDELKKILLDPTVDGGVKKLVRQCKEMKVRARNREEEARKATRPQAEESAETIELTHQEQAVGLIAGGVQKANLIQRFMMHEEDVIQGRLEDPKRTQSIRSVIQEALDLKTVAQNAGEDAKKKLGVS